MTVNKAHCVEGSPWLFRLADKYKWERNLVACVLCELFCSFFLMYGGISAGCVQTIQNKTTSTSNFKYGESLNWGVWLVLATYLGNALSGPHCNPAFSFLFFVLGVISLKRLILYALAQFIGCFIGSLMVFVVYFDAISDFDGGQRQIHGPQGTAGVFATYPKDYLTLRGALWDQFATTVILSMLSTALSDFRNKIPKAAQPALNGASLWAIVSMWSLNCGAALNPARDFSPRLMTLMVGYGWEVFSYQNYQWFFVPITMPFLGALAGAFLYKYSLGNYLSSSNFSSK